MPRRLQEAANFPTECFFLTLEMHHSGLLPSCRRYQRRLRVIRELQRAVEEVEATEDQWKSTPVAQRNRSLIQKWKDQIKKFAQSKLAADVALLDPICIQVPFTRGAKDHKNPLEV